MDAARTGSHYRHCPGRRRLRAGLAVLLALGPCGAAAAESASPVYRSYAGPGSLPIYSDRPLNHSSRVIAFFEVERRRRPAHETGKTMRGRALEPLLRRAAGAHGVRAALLKAVIEVESGFDAHARSPRGAVGLMQVMPATAARYGHYDLYSPAQNIDVGAHYLSDLLTRFDGNLGLALAAYNAGENAVLRSGGRIPDYAETRRYVPRVLERYRHYLPDGLP